MTYRESAACTCETTRDHARDTAWWCRAAARHEFSVDLRAGGVTLRGLGPRQAQLCAQLLFQYWESFAPADDHHAEIVYGDGNRLPFGYRTRDRVLYGVPMANLSQSEVRDSFVAAARAAVTANGSTDLKAGVQDLLTNVRHLCAAEGLDFAALDSAAQLDYDAETAQ